MCAFIQTMSAIERCGKFADEAIATTRAQITAYWPKARLENRRLAADAPGRRHRFR